MRATEQVIKEDHAQIRRALAVMEEMASRVREGGEAPLRGGDADDMVLFLQAFVDRRHNGREEGVLFPPLLQDRSQVNSWRVHASVY